MQKIDNLELIDVQYSNDNKKATLIFLDEEHGEIREVNFNKQIYDDGKYIDNKEKAEKIETWIIDLFGLTFDTLSDAIGTRKDVYVYEKYNGLYEVPQIEKFTEDMLGQIYEGIIKEITDNGNAILIRFEIDEKLYESKMSYSEYVEIRKKWFVNPQKKDKQYKKFEDKFGVSFDDKDKLIGKKIMVEIRKAMGKYIWGDIKPLPKKGKERG